MGQCSRFQMCISWGPNHLRPSWDDSPGSCRLQPLNAPPTPNPWTTENQWTNTDFKSKTYRLHPGRLTAGTYKSPILKGKWSEPNLHDYVPAVNLQRCMTPKNEGKPSVAMEVILFQSCAFFCDGSCAWKCKPPWEAAEAWAGIWQ